jgi:hypothetical protein
MTSLVDIFINSAAPIANAVIGTGTMTLSNGVVLTGVWSTVSASSESMPGGEQFGITATVIVPASASITKSLNGKTGTYQGINMRVANVEIGTTESTVMFVDETEGLKL